MAGNFIVFPNWSAIVFRLHSPALHAVQGCVLYTMWYRAEASKRIEGGRPIYRDFTDKLDTHLSLISLGSAREETIFHHPISVFVSVQTH